MLADRDLDGVLLIGTAGQDTLLVAGAEVGALSAALTQVVGAVSAAQQQTLVTEDAIPAASGDARGLSAFDLAVGWVVGGYLVAAIIGVSSGLVPRTRSRAGVRPGTLAVNAVVSGIGGAVIAGPVLGSLDMRSVPLTAFGALVVFAVGAATMALQVWTGLVGIGVAILIFVVLGNPSAGGASPPPALSCRRSGPGSGRGYRRVRPPTPCGASCTSTAWVPVQLPWSWPPTGSSGWRRRWRVPVVASMRTPPRWPSRRPSRNRSRSRSTGAPHPDATAPGVQHRASPAGTLVPTAMTGDRDRRASERAA